MFKIESYIGPLLMGYLNKYVKLNEESFKLSLWGGDAVFHNVELQCDILEHLMLLPIGFKSGQVHELKIHIPWTKLGSESVVITLNTVECILELKSDFIKKNKAESPTESLNSEKLSPDKQKIEKITPPSYIKSYLFNIISNIHVVVNNLIIKFVEDDIVLSMNAKTLEYFPVNDEWVKGFINLSSGNLKVNKVIEVFDLTICLDRMDGNGQIDVYQEPILYRCSVQCRFVTNYQSIHSNLPNFIQLNIAFGDLDINISTSQMPQLRRLIELIYALYYGVINWDAIVGCGYSNQIIVDSAAVSNNVTKELSDNVDDCEVVQQLTDGDSVDNGDNKGVSGQPSWASWAWSYVPSIFSEDDSNLSDIDAIGTHLKKIVIFAITFKSIHVKIKKSQITKSLFGSRRSNSNKTLNHFFSIIGNNIGINIINNGLSFYNVQLGCSEIKLLDIGSICVCGQEIPNYLDNGEKLNGNEFIKIGKPEDNLNKLSSFYLSSNLFSENEDGNSIENDIARVNSITSDEIYAGMYSQEKCLATFEALWFDYIYFMQIVKNNLEESHIDLLNLCNTDGIRESSHCNVYIGQSIVEINSYFIHNMKEIMKSLDTSRYLSYFRPPNNDNTHNILHPLEEQVARIHEFVPVRKHNVVVVNLSIKIHAFTESHQIADEFPLLELKTNNLKFSKHGPMYPRHLIECVSLLNTNLIKESTELIVKCYLVKSFELNGFSILFSLPVIGYDNIHSNESVHTQFLDPCDISLTTKSILYPDNWKTTSLMLSEKYFNVSKIKLTLIPSLLKASSVILTSNYPWISTYIGNVCSSSSTVYKRLDDLTLLLLGSQSSLMEACHKYFYKSKTHELHISLPNFVLKFRKTSISSIIDVNIFKDALLVYLQDSDGSYVIPVLDNKCDTQSNTYNKPTDLFVLSCQIPNEIKHVNCTFNLRCQVGSINFMFSQPLASWFIYPLLDLDIDQYIDSDIFPRFPTMPKKNSTNRSSVTIPDIRSIADGSSRPESPNIFYNKQPIPGLPKPINIHTEKLDTKNQSKINFLSNKTGWWNLVKNSCSKYFFLLQSLDVCIKMCRSKFYITTITDLSNLQSHHKFCNDWVEEYLHQKPDDGLIFAIKITRLAFINSQRRDYLNEAFKLGPTESFKFPTKPKAIIDSLPWELIFHDISIDCVHVPSSNSETPTKLVHDSILKPVSINCTLSGTPKCSSPDKLESLYSVSWGVHIDITEVQPTIKQIYLAKLLKFFGNIVLGLPWTDFIKNLKYIGTAHSRIIKDTPSNINIIEDKPIFRSKQSASTKSTKKSKSSLENNEYPTNPITKGRIINSKLESRLFDEIEAEFKMSFWIQCTLSQFQLIIMNDVIEMDDSEPYMYLMLQVDDATSCIDVQEKFVEIKGKLGSILCQVGQMKQEKMISEIPILKTGSKFIKTTDMPFSYKSSDDSQDLMDEIGAENIIRHCFSIAVIRTTPNNLSKRPISSYHQFKDNESFKSYPTEFTGNFSTAIDVTNKYQSYITQISSIIDPFDLYLPPFFIKQCIELSNTFVSLCNQLLETSVKKWSLSSKLSSPISASSIRNEPYFISEDMPQFHLLIKSSRIILPRYQNEQSNIFDQSTTNNNDCIIAIWKKISLQPFSNNAICRPSIIEKSNEDIYSSNDSQSKSINRLDDNRQFQFDIFQFGIFLNQSNTSVTSFEPSQFNFDGIQRENNRSTEAVNTLIIHGQNPAFEWNNFSKLSSFNQNNAESDLLPIMKPIDIQIIFAGAIHESSNTGVKRQLRGGYGLEINILTNLEFFFDHCTLDVLKSITNNISDIFPDCNDKLTSERLSCCDNNISEFCSLEDFCRMKNIDNFIPCVPINILMTTRKIQILLLLQKLVETNPLSPVHGLSISISQPHAMLSFKNRENHKFEIAFFDVNFSVTPAQWSEKINFHDRNHLNFWLNRQSFIFAEMKTLMKTKPGRPDLKTGVPASLLTMTFSNFYRASSSQCIVNITRQILINVTIEDITQISGIIKLLSTKFHPMTNEENNNKIVSLSSSPFPMTVLIPNNVCICSEMLSIKISGNINQDDYFELKLGPFNVSSNVIRNFQWNNLYLTAFFRCDSFVWTHCFQVNDQISSTFIIYPTKITGKTVISYYKFNCLDSYWKSLEWVSEIDIGVVNISLKDHQLITLYKLLVKIGEIISYHNQNETITLTIKNCEGHIDNRVEIFYDDLRTSKYQLITNINTKENDYVSICGSSLIADEATISFSDDNDEVSSMMWTYPEPRCIISLEVKPVPFVFIECNIMKDENYEQLQIPCKLEYWNIFTNQYELYRKFNLSESHTEKMENLPTIEELSMSNKDSVVAKSWRVVFDCYARYVNRDQEILVYSEKAMLVYLSPLVLAASMRVDSIYGSYLIKNSMIKLTLPQIDFTFYENDDEIVPNEIVKPYKSIAKTYNEFSISDHHIIFKCSMTDVIIKEIINEIKKLEISKIELFVADPFLALQLPIVVLESLYLQFHCQEKMVENFVVDIDSCQCGFDTISLKQLYMIVDNMRFLLDHLLQHPNESNKLKKSLNKSQLLICNNLNRRIRIKQKEDNFLKLSDSVRVGGLECGDAITLKFLPVKKNILHINNDELCNRSNDRIEIMLGICSELKGSVKWTEPLKLPFPDFNDISATAYSNLGIWKLDSNMKSDVSMLLTSSTLSNSFNAKNLFFIQNYSAEGLNKIIILGNTIINNGTSEFIHINFSLPAELSSGVSFNVPPQTNSIPTSQYINWKFISSSPSVKNIFELSFRIIKDHSENTEYRSSSYQIEAPKLSETSKTNCQQQIIIKVKLYKAEGEIISNRNLHCQFLCTFEWFKFLDEDEMLLIITISPLVIVENQMLRDVKLEITNNENKDIHYNEERLIVKGNGGYLKMFNLFSVDNVQLNASFINDNSMLFDKSLNLTEDGILLLLSKKLSYIYENKFDKFEKKNKLNYIAELLVRIIENNESIFKKNYLHNPYSIIVTIAPWILISNKTHLNLVLSFDKHMYFMESNSDFIPSQSDKPMKIGITFENDVFWTKQFFIGKNAIDETENSISDINWKFIKNDIKDEAVIQMNVIVGKQQYIIPLTLKHLFVDNTSNSDDINSSKFHNLIIESTIMINNLSKSDLTIEALCLPQNNQLNINYNEIKDGIAISPKDGYIPISQFQSIGISDANDTIERLMLKINLSKNNSLSPSLFNCLTMMDLNVFTNTRESEIDMETDFLYVKDMKQEENKIDFKAFTINSTPSLAMQKIFIDIYECQFVPIKITNWSSQIILISELVDLNKWTRSSLIQVEPMQTVPYWPIDFQLDINKDGCGNFSRSYNRFRFGVEMETNIDWTEYFPLICTDLFSTVNITTMNGGQCLKLVLESDTHAKIHINIYHQAQAIRKSISEISDYLVKKLSISRLSFSLLERQTDLENIVESVRVSIENAVCCLSSHPNNDKVIYEISANHIQIDNKLFSTGFYDFPVFFNSIKSLNSKDKFVSIQLQTGSSSSYSLDVSFYNELELFVENIFLYDLLRIISQFSHCIIPKNTNNNIKTVPVVSIPALNIIHIKISPILLRLTVHAFLKIYVSCESTSLGLPEFVINNSSLRFTAFQKQLWNHYVSAALVRCGCVLGSMELFGNPNGIVRHLATGLTDLLSSRNIDHGLLADFLLRLLSFCRHTSGGFISSFTGIASSVSRNLDYFTLDDIHINRQDLLRRRCHTNGVMLGFISGLSGFALSLLGAVAGLADQPLQASQEALNNNSSVSIAVIKGLGKGIIGAFTKPLGGTAELLAQTGRGLLNTTGIAVNRNHSELVSFKLTSHSDILINVYLFLGQSYVDDIKNDGDIPGLLWSCIATNDEHIPVYLILTKHYLIEWCIDNPLRNRKIVYQLSNYSISALSNAISKYCLRLYYADKMHNDLHANPDSRLNAFISELQYANDVNVIHNSSRTSSMDSTEYVKFTSLPITQGGYNNSNTNSHELDNLSTINAEEINFYSTQSFDGILNALTFLNYHQQEQE